LQLLSHADQRPQTASITHVPIQTCQFRLVENPNS
jgi:hypothetical protein